MSIPSIRLEDFIYDLPGERIALHPLQERHASKLLVAHLPQRRISDRRFFELPECLPPGALLVANDSRVVPARIPAKKPSGGGAEIFLLDPLEPTPNPTLALEKGPPAVWNALIGGKKIREGDRLLGGGDQPALVAEILEKSGSSARVRLHWPDPKRSLASVLEEIGRLPLPPYLKREVQTEDHARYQTIFARAAGSVAAPTAGLHFSPEVREGLQARSIEQVFLTLHVGAGTFRPVESETAAGHAMHAERFEVTPEFLERVSRQLAPEPGRAPLVAVGTTSLRTLESLFWMGLDLLEGGEGTRLNQWTAYDRLARADDDARPAHEVFRSFAEVLRKRGLSKWSGTTSLMIVPGYRFQTADRLLTNFHQPGSSLILLVAAWAGEEWRKIYDHALASDYRFLSYGDSSLLIRS